MKISIWFKITDQPWGGGNQFLRALSQTLSRLGHAVFDHPVPNVDVILLNSHNRGPNLYLNINQVAQLRSMGKVTWWGKFISPQIWAQIQRKGSPIVHRLDGVAALIRGHQTNADRLQFGVNPLCDFTIFQSAYSQQSFSQFGLNPGRSHVIHNGVDGNIFYPSPVKKIAKNNLHLVAVSWSSNLRKGFSTLAKVSNLPDVQLSFIGNWSPEVNPGKTILLGVKKSTEIAEILRQSDALIHASENENCSNAILEALACGLPILYKDSGGNREIAESYGISLTDHLEENISQLINCFNDLKEKIAQDHPKFLIDYAAEAYLNVFREIL